MSWENLAEDILGEFAGHANCLHDRELDAWMRLKREQVEQSQRYYLAHRADILLKVKARYQAVKADPARYVRYLAQQYKCARKTQRERARRWYERMKADPRRHARFIERMRTNQRRLRADSVKHAEYKRKKRERYAARRSA